MKILACAVTNRSADILKPHVMSLLAQELPKKTALDLAYISDNLSEEAEKVLETAGARVSTCLEKPPTAHYAVTETTHEWTLDVFGWLAREKQRLLELAR